MNDGNSDFWQTSMLFSIPSDMQEFAQHDQISADHFAKYLKIFCHIKNPGHGSSKIHNRDVLHKPYKLTNTLSPHAQFAGYPERSEEPDTGARRSPGR